jgi:hypothetical protein
MANKHILLLFAVAILLSLAPGCATIRVTDPTRTATEQFLMSVATEKAIAQLSLTALRDRAVYVDPSYLTEVKQPSAEHTFLLGELRARLLAAGVRLADRRQDAEVILEVRSGAVGVDRIEFLLGIPAIYQAGSETVTGGIPVAIPELAIVKRTTQRGYSSVAYVAYWRDTGEWIVSSGPFVGRTIREDYWFFGVGPRTTGNIPTTETGQ